ncbi:MAG: DUF4345 family protein [Chloroflexota bacterium]
MTKERIFLYVAAAFYLLFAILYMVFPLTLAGAMGVTTADSTGIIDIRAVYGGFQLGLAIFLFWAAGAEEWTYPGLLITVLTTGGIAIVRLVSMVISWEIGNHWIGLAIEVVVTLIATVLILRRE